jgi:integrase
VRKITPNNNNGSIRLSFSVGGHRYSFAPIPGGDYGDRRDMKTATSIATRIENDIIAGNFDPTLDRYRIVPKFKPEPPLPIFTDWLTIFDAWIDTLEISASAMDGHYKAVRSMLASIEPKPRIPDIKWIPGHLALATLKTRVGILRRCGKWAFQHGHIANNPWEDYKYPKLKPTPIEPFSKTEIAKIIAGFDHNCPHYSNFVRFLFLTGVRMSEGIGLRYSDIDRERGLIKICSSLPIAKPGNRYRRIRKGTKTGSTRDLPITPRLAELFPHSEEADDLIFKAKKGGIIDGNSFRHRYWQKVLKNAGVSYRKIHNTRHSFASHSLAQGIPITEIAYLLGHSDTAMILKVYGHRIGTPTMPTIF